VGLIVLLFNFYATPKGVATGSAKAEATTTATANNKNSSLIIHH
jgi:hypothetical protein